MSEKPVVTTNNGFFPVLAANVQNQQNSRFIVSLYHPVVVLRRRKCQRFESSRSHQEQHLMGCCSFCFAWILWGSKRSGFEQPVPRALRPAGQKRPSGAFLGRGLANPFGHTQKASLQCTLRSKAVIVGLIFNTRQETISVSHIVMFAEKTYNAFEPVGHTKRGKERES